MDIIKIWVMSNAKIYSRYLYSISFNHFLRASPLVSNVFLVSRRATSILSRKQQLLIILFCKEFLQVLFDKFFHPLFKSLSESFFIKLSVFTIYY